MVIGNPYEFAVILEEISSWNPGNYSLRNGILFYCFDGTLFPSQVYTATLSHDLFDLLPRLKAIPDDQTLFTGCKDDVFRHLYLLHFPGDREIDQECRYDITPATFQDLHHYTFAVKGNGYVRILANKLPYIKEESTHDLTELNTLEAIIPLESYRNTVDALEKWYIREV